MVDKPPHTKLPALEELLSQNVTWLLGFTDVSGGEEITGVPAASLNTLRSRGGGPVFFRPDGTTYIRYNRLELFRWMFSGGAKTSTSDPGTPVKLPASGTAANDNVPQPDRKFASTEKPPGRSG